jgi:hypothetical protein
MNNTTIEVERKLVRRMVGKDSMTLSASGFSPNGERLVG